MPVRKRLGNLLMAAGAINQEQLDIALKAQSSEQRKRQLGDILISLGFITEEQIAVALSQQMGLPRVDLSSHEFESRLSTLVPRRVMDEHHVIPLSLKRKTLMVAMADPTDIQAVDYLRTITGYRIERAVTTHSELRKFAGRLYDGYSSNGGHTQPVQLRRLKNRGSAAASSGPRPVDRSAAGQASSFHNEEISSDALAATEAGTIETVNDAIKRALSMHASDLHFVATEGGLLIRMRVDGKLMDASRISVIMQPSVIARVKLLANLDITERRRPQEGHARVLLGSSSVDLRISTVPTLHGETAILRLLESIGGSVQFEQLGFTPAQMQTVDKHLFRPQGLVLVTGPTGSGKSTSLYSMIRRRQRPDVHIITIEDPVEYEIPGISQVNVDERSGLTFATGMRSLVRLDPDIIMVGEVRDVETAQIAFQAALTGHLVLSTLHTNDAISAVARLIHMGIEPYLIASALSMVIAQRLLREVCQQCAVEVPITPEERLQLGVRADEPVDRLIKGIGCDFCNNTGFRHRVGVFQMVEMDEGLKELILARAPESELRRYSVSKGMRTLRQEGVIKALMGATSLSEVLAVTEPD